MAQSMSQADKCMASGYLVIGYRLSRFCYRAMVRAIRHRAIGLSDGVIGDRVIDDRAIGLSMIGLSGYRTIGSFTAGLVAPVGFAIQPSSDSVSAGSVPLASSATA